MLLFLESQGVPQLLLSAWDFLGLEQDQVSHTTSLSVVITQFFQAWALVALARINLHPTLEKCEALSQWLLWLLLVSAELRLSSLCHLVHGGNWECLPGLNWS